MGVYFDGFFFCNGPISWLMFKKIKKNPLLKYKITFFTVLYINIVLSDRIKQYKYFYFYTCTKCESQTIYRHNTGSHHPAPVQCSFFQWLVLWKGNFAKKLSQCCVLILCCQNKEGKKKKQTVLVPTGYLLPTKEMSVWRNWVACKWTNK